MTESKGKNRVKLEVESRTESGAGNLDPLLFDPEKNNPLSKRKGEKKNGGTHD